MNKWIKLESALPELGVEVVVYPDLEGQITIASSTPDEGDTVFFLERDCCEVFPTHWMALPEVPED